WVVSSRSTSVTWSSQNQVAECPQTANSGHSIEVTLIHISEPTTPPRFASARVPLQLNWLEADFDQTYLKEAETMPEFEFDQTMNW
ncbi:MAG: hypothetical protein KAJ03_06010, partial [Gammaproteobacteria bacterium]|nr:hypothetical protein [Gammaproteobacteria bacterium]